VHNPGVTSNYTKEFLSSIWSIRRRAEFTVRIGYRVEDAGRCRIFSIERIEPLEP
jgi:hypothetical protein